jgi:pilus assembly protein Flp/PilA
MIKSFFERLISERSGATAIEYGLICALISMAAMGAMKVFADENTFMWMNVTSKTLAAVQ